MLKNKILDSVKKDLSKTDIIFTYELQKVGRKYSKIILNTHLDLEKYNSQNPELEKVPTKNKYKVNKYNVNKSKLITNTFEKQKSKIIEKYKKIANIIFDKNMKENSIKNWIMFSKYYDKLLR